MTASAAVERALTTTDAWGCIETRIDGARSDATESDARKAAGRSRGPLDGLAFAVKANLDVEGLPTTAGTGVVRPAAAKDAAVVRQLREAGAIPVLTTTLAEAALGSVTANPWTGTCLSPPDPSAHAGGSSGGSAAAVAAGLVPFALGSDTMGSVRIPAACCGVIGWKPTHGLLSNEGLVPLSSELDTVGVLTSSIDLLTEVASILAGSEQVAAPQRVGVVSLEVATDAGSERAVTSSVARLREAGVEIHEISLDLDAALVRRRGLLLCEAEASAYWGSAVDGDPPGLSEPLRALLAYGRDAAPASVAAARALRLEVEQSITRAFERVDALVLPTLPGRGPLVGQDPAGLADLTAFVNLAQVPALSMPTTVVEAGERVPRSIQLVGPRGSDLALIAMARDTLG